MARAPFLIRIITSSRGRASPAAPARERWAAAQAAVAAHLESGRGEWRSAWPKPPLLGASAAFAIVGGLAWAMRGGGGLMPFWMACALTPAGGAMLAYAWTVAKENRARRLSVAMTGVIDSFYDPLFAQGETAFAVQLGELNREIERARHAMEIEDAANEGVARTLNSEAGTGSESRTQKRASVRRI